MNEMIKVENNNLIVADEVINKMKEFQKIKKEIEEKENQLKQSLLDVMDKYSIEKWTSPDESLTVNYIPDTFMRKFNKTSFKKDYPDLYDKYSSFSTKAGYVKLQVKD